jgi:uncharacterized protein DUF4032
MEDSTYRRAVAQMASTDFDRARRKAFFNELETIFRGKPSALVSFEEVERILPLQGQYYRGVQHVPISSVVGSVNRYRDFDREFLPVQSHTRPRWESVDIANMTDVNLPPVQLYKVDNVYFVKDGNHRISVAREKGVDFIDAEVIECPTTVPVTHIGDQQDLLRLAEYARFLEQTRLDKLRDNVCIEFTSLGRYDVLLEHISAHRWYMGIEQKRPIEWEEAVLDWYDNIYMPLVNAIRDTHILDHFPGHTEGDLYLWIMDHRWYLTQNTGEDVGPITATLSYDASYTRWTRKIMRFMRRLHEAATRPLVISGQRIARALKASSRGEGQQADAVVAEPASDSVV